MFKEQYIRDNDKLYAKETLLMEIKQKSEAEEKRAKTRNRYVRYGAVAAAVLLVVGGAVGALLAARGQNPKADNATLTAESAAADSSVLMAAAPEEAMDVAVESKAGSAEGVRPVTGYDELRDMIFTLQGGENGMNAKMDAATASGAGVETAVAEESASDSAASYSAAAQAAAPAAMDGGMGGGTAEHSETNTQVAGVDEADIVKTDGAYIYYLAGNQLTIVKADGKDTSIVSATSLAEKENWWSFTNELFLLGDRLMVITEGYRTVWAGGNMGNVDQQQTRVLLYDIADRTAPKRIATLGQSGSYVSSRMVGDYVYLVTAQNVWYMDRNVPETYLPVLFSGETSKTMAAADISTFYRPNQPAYTVIGAINLRDGTDYASSQAMFGATADIYCNKEHLLLACGDYRENVSDILPDENGKNVQTTESASYTRLVLYGINNGAITRIADGEVPGSLLNQFSMDEYNGVFRIVTSVYHSTQRIYTDGVDTYEYDDENWNALYTLDDSLEILGKLENLAKDEWVQSVRFMGNVGYFVTFRQVDPLFSVDLTDPAKPVVLSALKIPGFSAYLHPFGTGMLLGIGYAADEKTGATQGVKLSMFDVSNPADVKEENVEKVDADWTIVGSNHKAILVSKEKNLIAFPADGSYFLYSYEPAKGFTLLSKVNVEDDLYNWNLRGLFVGENFYVLSEGGVTVIDMQTFAKIAHVTISYG